MDKKTDHSAMRKRPSGEDLEYFPDYLIKGVRPTFSSSIHFAYRKQYNCRTLQHIATVIKATTGHVSHVLNHPEDLESKGLQRFLKPLESGVDQRRIITAWTEAKWPSAFAAKTADEIATPPITQETVDEINRRLRSPRHQFVAMNAAVRALQRTDAPILQDALLATLRFSHGRLGNLGRAMFYTRLAVDRAREHSDGPAEASALLFRAFVLMHTEGTNIESLRGIEDRISFIVNSLPNPPPTERAANLKSFDLPFLRTEIDVFQMEQGPNRVEARRLELIEKSVSTLMPPEVGYRMLNQTILLGRICLLRGNIFGAEEACEAAKQIQTKNKLSFGMSACTRFRAQIIEKRLGTEAAADFLFEAIVGVESTGDYYTPKILEMWLAGLENRRF